MTPERSTVINGKRIEEFYWAGNMVVYVDFKKYEGTYEDAINFFGKDKALVQK